MLIKNISIITRVEEFLSKDISYLISNKKEAKFAQTLGRISPVPSPEPVYTAETTSPHPSHDGSSFKAPDTVCLSRGKLLVEKAIKDHVNIRNYIEQKKKELYLLKKSSTSIRDGGKRVSIGTQKARSRLKKPFVKVEDISQFQMNYMILKYKTSNMFSFIIKILMYLSFYSFRLYRPFYLQLTSMPFINYSAQKPSSPFDVDKPSTTQKQTQVKLRLV
ncbi:hypothetical protein J1605_003043 [Eschrichtius robustus]|uniref:Uncharacterized protein n=1 Tax=Eschrichtius robustus TaxID=9764 RepID=A0AB34HWB4_ESCRO|nr:hypothetical protein J1605_003043 [Eschrichtius robustus]